MDRRTLLAVAISFGIFIAWQKFYIEPRTRGMAPAQRVSQSADEPAKTEKVIAAEKAPSVAPPETTRPRQTLTISTETGDAILSDGGPFLAGWDLRGYRVGLTQKAAAVDLASVSHIEAGNLEFSFDDPAYGYASKAQGTFSRVPGGSLWVYEDANLKMQREVTSAPGQTFLKVRVTTEFKSKPPKYAFVSLGSRVPEKDPEERDRQIIYWSDQSLNSVHPGKAKLEQVLTPVKYMGVANRYFLLAWVAEGVEPTATVQPLGENTARVNFAYPITGKSISFSSRVYFGPKELNLLRSVEPTLDHAVDFGWFTLIAYPLLKLLRWLYSLFSNYGVAIIALTLILKILTFPLTYKSMKSMKQMARIQPQLQRLKERHKDDREALNREMLSLMRTNGYNPMAGCLPILIQMPVFFALYRVLYSSIELFHAPFALWIQDLSAHDHFYVTPVLLTLTMFFQQRLTPTTATDPAQQKMMQFMPIMFGFFMLWLPSGLTIYMLTNAIASIVQQLILNKKLDIHHAQPVAARAR